MSDKVGKFIVIEGGEGVGKDAQIDRLKAEFSDRDIEYTWDPGRTPVGEEIRQIFLSDRDIDMAIETEIYLLAASRTELLRQVVRPALAHGRHVISNRFVLSTMAYQIYGRGREDLLPLIERVNRFVLQEVLPDLYIFLDVPPAVSLARVRSRARGSDRIEKEGLDFYEKVHAGYLRALFDRPHVVIDGSRSVEEVHHEIKQEILKVIDYPF